jgi:hypothetical protein
LGEGGAGVGATIPSHPYLSEQTIVDCPRPLQAGVPKPSYGTNHAVNLDGYGALAIKTNGKLSLYSRKRKSFNRQY